MAGNFTRDPRGRKRERPVIGRRWSWPQPRDIVPRLARTEAGLMADSPPPPAGQRTPARATALLQNRYMDFLQKVHVSFILEKALRAGVRRGGRRQVAAATN